MLHFTYSIGTKTERPALNSVKRNVLYIPAIDPVIRHLFASLILNSDIFLLATSFAVYTLNFTSLFLQDIVRSRANQRSHYTLK